MLTQHTSRIRLLITVIIGVFVMSACGNMREQPKLQKPFDASPLFGSAARELDPNAVSYSPDMPFDEYYNTGAVDGESGDGIPIELSVDVLKEGRRKYEAFCAPCHGYDGYGNGVTSQEGYPQPGPASYHIDRLREMPDGYFFEVISEGIGTMYNYAARLSIEDRWAVVAYVRALQISQNVSFDDLPADFQAEPSN